MALSTHTSTSRTSRRSAGSSQAYKRAQQRSRATRGALVTHPGGHGGSTPRTGGAFAAVGRGLGAAWRVTAKGLGSGVRAVGVRARTSVEEVPRADLSPHRRDGIALTLFAVAIIIAGSVWFSAARPVGEWVEIATRSVVGSGAVVLPVICIAWGVLLMVREPNPTTHCRWLIGVLIIAIAALGIGHVVAGQPGNLGGVQHAAGVLGRVVGGGLAAGVTGVVAVLLLLLLIAFGALIVVGRPARDIPQLIRAAFNPYAAHSVDDVPATDDDADLSAGALTGDDASGNEPHDPDSPRSLRGHYPANIPTNATTVIDAAHVADAATDDTDAADIDAADIDAGRASHTAQRGREPAQIGRAHV